MKIAIGNDHAAVELKKTIMEYVESMGHEVTNFGTDSSESCNYPEYGEKVADAVASGEFDCGILICGTGAVSYTHLDVYKRQIRSTLINVRGMICTESQRS